MNVLNDKKMCTGCGACRNVCPTNSIRMKEDEEGFFSPVIDAKTCINCEKCRNICPQNNVSALLNEPLAVYAAQGRSETLLASSSGGVADAIASHFVKDGGVAFGAVFDENIAVMHEKISTLEELNKLQGSKYVQSVFHNVQQDILLESAKRPVVVFGTPCQIAALKVQRKLKCENLYFVDLICHGVASPGLFEKYLKWLEKKMGGKIKRYSFRDKAKWDWGTIYKATAATATETVTITATEDPYYLAFLYAETYRECCYSCKYSTGARVGDITIGDYWGIEKGNIKIEFDLKAGVSAVLVNTKKGEQLWNEICECLKFYETTFKEVSRDNTNLQRPAKRPKVRNVFYKKIATKGFEWAVYRMYTNSQYYINRGKQIVPVSVKKKIKRLINK